MTEFDLKVNPCSCKFYASYVITDTSRQTVMCIYLSHNEIFQSFENTMRLWEIIFEKLSGARGRHRSRPCKYAQAVWYRGPVWLEKYLRVQLL